MCQRGGGRMWGGEWGGKKQLFQDVLYLGSDQTNEGGHTDRDKKPRQGWSSGPQDSVHVCVYVCPCVPTSELFKHATMYVSCPQLAKSCSFYVCVCVCVCKAI